MCSTCVLFPCSFKPAPLCFSCLVASIFVCSLSVWLLASVCHLMHVLLLPIGLKILHFGHCSFASCCAWAHAHQPSHQVPENSDKKLFKKNDCIGERTTHKLYMEPSELSTLNVACIELIVKSGYFEPQRPFNQVKGLNSCFFSAPLSLLLHCLVGDDGILYHPCLLQLWIFQVLE